MLHPVTSNIKDFLSYAHSLKAVVTEKDQSHIDVRDQIILLQFLKLAHPQCARVDATRSILSIGSKPEGCDRPGTSNTCYYVQVKPGEKMNPLWFADCRASIRTQRGNCKKP